MIIDGVSEIIGQTTSGLVGNIYNATKAILDETLLNFILIIIASLWVWNKIGREWSKEDFYKAGSWVIMFLCIKAIYLKYSYFESFLNFVNLPVQWFYGALGKNYSASANIDNSIEYSIFLAEGIWNHISLSEPVQSLLCLILGLLVLAVIWLYALFLVFFIVFVSIVSTIILAVCPIMLPCLIIPNMKGYFFSWLKLYISTAMQPIFACIISVMMQTAINNFRKSGELTLNIQNLDNKENLLGGAGELFVIIILCIIGIKCLSKIPVWTQQIIGSGDGEHKTGLAGLAAAGGVMASKGFKGFQQARNDMNYETGKQNSFGRSLASGLASMIGMQGSAQKIAGQTGANRQAYQDRMLKEAMQNGAFTSTPTPHIDTKPTSSDKK